MAIVTTLDAVRDWVESEICSQVQLKVPDNDVVDEGYRFKLVHPAAFSMYTPTDDKLPEGVESPIPSVTIRITEGEDTLTKGTREMKVTLLFAAWSPGLHAGDYLETIRYERDDNGVLRQITSVKKYPENAEVFNMDAEGWRDAWNFVDTAVRIIENVEYLGGYRFMKERGLKFAPVASQEATPEYWPFWFANVEFFISETIGAERKHVLYDNLL